MRAQEARALDRVIGMLREFLSTNRAAIILRTRSKVAVSFWGASAKLMRSDIGSSVHNGSHSFQRPKIPNIIRATANNIRNISNIVTRSIWLRAIFAQGSPAGGDRSPAGQLACCRSGAGCAQGMIVAQNREFFSVRHKAVIDVGTDRRSGLLRSIGYWEFRHNRLKYNAWAGLL